MSDNSFPKRFWASRLTGFYCRVIQEGYVSAGDFMQFQSYPGTKISIGEWIANEPLTKLDEAARARFLSVPLHYKTRQILSW